MRSFPRWWGRIIGRRIVFADVIRAVFGVNGNFSPLPTNIMVKITIYPRRNPRLYRCGDIISRLKIGYFRGPATRCSFNWRLRYHNDCLKNEMWNAPALFVFGRYRLLLCFDFRMGRRARFFASTGTWISEKTPKSRYYVWTPYPIFGAKKGKYLEMSLRSLTGLAVTFVRSWCTSRFLYMAPRKKYGGIYSGCLVFCVTFKNLNSTLGNQQV